MSLRIVIVEDEVNARKILINLLKEINSSYQIIAEASSLKEAKAIIQTTPFDLMLLDVQLRDGNGFDLLKELESIDFQVIFTTAFSQYAIEAFKVNAVDYLLKPIDSEELKVAIDKVQGKDKKDHKPLVNLLNHKTVSNRLALNERNRIVFIQTNDIIYLKADGAYTKIFCEKEKEYLSSNNLGYFEKKLMNSTFLRIHRSFLVNIHKVVNIRTDEHQVEMNNGHLTSLSTNSKQELLKRLS